MAEVPLTPIWAAVIGGAAGALAGLVGVFVDHWLASLRSNQDHELQQLENIAVLLDRLRNGLMNLPHRTLLGKEFDAFEAYQLQTLVQIYLPEAMDRAGQVSGLVTLLVEDIWVTISTSDRLETVIRGGRGGFIEHARRDWGDRVNQVLDLLNPIEDRLKARIEEIVRS